MFTEKSTEIIQRNIVHALILVLESYPYAPNAGLGEVVHVCLRNSLPLRVLKVHTQPTSSNISH